MIGTLINLIKRDDRGAAYGYLMEHGKVASVKDAFGRKSALFCYGIEELQLDRWVPVKFATYDLEEAKAAKIALENELGTAYEFRIVRFIKNVEIKQERLGS